MPKRQALMVYEKCRPGECAPADGICPAALVCPRGIMEQEEPYEPPMIAYAQMCQGCADCLRVCPFDAIVIA